MIIEDYVSFETAKLLKEKGFNIPTEKFYNKRGTSWFCASAYDWNYAGEEYSRPTLQMAMKWLREEHKIGVFPSTYGLTVGVNGSVKHVYGTAIINLETYELMINDIMPMPTYEEACDVAIKYCLENLI